MSSDDDWSAPTLHRATTSDAPAEPPAEVLTGGPATVAAPMGAEQTGFTALANALGPPTSAVDPVAGSASEAGGWSAAVLHSTTATAGDDGWGATTYAGTRRHRPRGDDHAVPATSEQSPEQVVESAAPVEDDRGRGSLLSSSRTMAIASLVSRITGLLRTVAIGAALGSAVGSVLDPYNTANALPNMVYELLIGGVLSSVLIPLIVYAQEHDSDRGLAYTQRLLSIATVVLGGATLLAVLAAPWISYVVVDDEAKRGLTTIFATLLLPEIFFYGVSALFVAVLNSRGVFGPPAWAPVLNNVVVLATVVVFLFLPGGTPTIGSITDLQILVLGIGTTLGIAVQALVVWPSLRRTGFVWRWRFKASSPEENTRLAEVRTLTLWVLGYVVASQIGVVVIQRVGTGQGSVGYSQFAYADLLFQVPYGVLGVSLLTALMPRMSRAAAAGDLRSVVDDLGVGARLSAVCLVPVTFLLAVLGPALTTTILLGKFAADAATLVGVTLAMSSFGLLPFALVMLQMRVFYALHDARTPTLMQAVMVASKLAFIGIAVLVFDSPARIIESLAVSTSLSYVVGAVAGHVLLQRRLGRLGFRAVGVTVARIAVASAAGAVVALVVLVAVDVLLDGPRTTAVVTLVVGGLLGLAATGAAAVALKIPEVRDVVAAVRPGGRGAPGPDDGAGHTRNTHDPAAVTAGENSPEPRRNEQQ